MRRALLSTLGVGLVVSSLILYQVGGVRGEAAFADPAFQQQWQQGEALTPNLWGPLSTAKDGQQEPYLQASGGQRLVQYFDKGRMELTNGTVTNGLLASEIVKGQVQVSDATFQPKDLPAIPIAGDPDNPGPTYAQLGGRASLLLGATPKQLGNGVAIVMDAGGNLQVNDATSGTGPTYISAYDDATKHNVPQAFADYRTEAGLLTIGLGISEPFLTRVKVGGQTKGVMVQVFERRALTYTPDNPRAFQVEMGNIGQHYYTWRYTGAALSSNPQAATQAPPSVAPSASGSSLPISMPAATAPFPTVAHPPDLPPPPSIGDTLRRRL